MTRQEQDLDSEVREAAAFHGHLGPFLVIGVRMGLIGLRELKTNKNDPRLQATAVLKQTPPFSCIIDGIQTTTHCTVGNGKLRLENKQQIISAVFSINKERQVTVTLKPTKFEEMKKALPKNRQSSKNIQLAREIAFTPEKELFTVKKRDNQQTDLKLARQRLLQKNLSLVISKNGSVLFETQASGISGLLEAIEKLGNKMAGASVADRIVGRAAALLLAYSGADAVFAFTISDSGIEVLGNHRIAYEFDERVPSILNLSKTDVCPFEKLAAKFSDPKKAYEELKARCPPKQAL